MNARIFFIPLLLTALCIASCGNSDTKTAVSTPVDSTNIKGTAPVEDKGVNPADTTQMRPLIHDTATNPGLSNARPDLKDVKQDQ